MGDYEIRILKTDGKPSLVYACSHMSDAGAIRSAGNIAREPGDRIEVLAGDELHTSRGRIAVAAGEEAAGKPAHAAF